MRRWKLVVALLLGGVVLAGIGSASAADLEVEVQLTVLEAGACTTDQLTVTRTDYLILWYGGVRISGIPEECQGLPISVSADNGSASGSLPSGATSSSVTIPTGLYWFTVRDFSAVFDGWHVDLARAS